MKRFRLVALLALFLCAVMLLASCGPTAAKDPRNVKSLKFNQIVKKVNSVSGNSVSLNKLSLEGNITSSNGDLFLLEKTGASRTVYNAELDKVVYSLTSATALGSTSVSLQSNCFVVYAEKQTTLYGGDGAEVASVPYAGATISSVEDLVWFGGKIYRFGEKDAKYTLTAVDGVKATTPLPGNVFGKSEKYYYTDPAGVTYSGFGSVKVKSIVAYDLSLNPVFTYYPEEAGNAEAFLLDNGNLAVQSRTALPADAADYTYYDAAGDVKYRLKTEVLDVKKGTAKEVDFPYVIRYSITIGSLAEDAGEEVELAKGFDNLTVVYPIVDRRVVENSGNEMLLSMGNDLSVKGRLDQIVKFQRPTSLFEFYNTDTIVFTLADGSNLITNKKLKEIGRVPSNAQFRSTYLLVGDSFCNYSLEELYNIGNNGFAVEDCFAEVAILSKDNASGDEELYLWKPGSEPTKIDAADDNLTYQQINDSVYAIADATDPTNAKITYYNGKGEALLTTEKLGAFSFATWSGDDVSLWYATDGEGNPVYYRYENK